MQRFWDVEKYYVKNPAKNLAVLNIFLNTHHYLDNPARPRLPSAVEKAANIASFSDKQTLFSRKKRKSLLRRLITPRSKHLSRQGSPVLTRLFIQKTMHYGQYPAHD